MSIGTLTLQKTPLNREANIAVTFDWHLRHEIASGATITSASAVVMLAGAASSDLTITAPVVDPTGKLVTVRVTDVNSQLAANQAYQLACIVNLSDGSGPIVEDVQVVVKSI